MIGQSIWNQYIQNNPWKQLWKNTFYSYNWPENNNTLYMLSQFATKTNDQIYRWTNPKHVNSPNVNYAKRKIIYITCILTAKGIKKSVIISKDIIKISYKKNTRHCNT